MITKRKKERKSKMQGRRHKRRVGWRALFHLELDTAQALLESLRDEVGFAARLFRPFFFATVQGSCGSWAAHGLLPQPKILLPLAGRAPAD